jgi:Xaa-Pro dipeptidase
MEKSPEEIRAITQATQICDETIQVLREQLRPGLRDYQVRGLIAGAIMERRGELAFAIVGSTPMKAPQFPFPFSIESSRTISTGDLVLNEFGARYMGYEGQTGRPFSIGPATSAFTDLWEVTVQGAYALEKALRPGALAIDVQKAGRKIYEEAGLVISAPMLHTLGICLSDPTIFFDHISGDPQFEFRPGMVVSLQSNPATPDHSMGLFMGNDYVVTDTGCRRLSTTPFEFIRI